MADDALVFRLEANIVAMENALAKAVRDVNKSAAQIDKVFDSVNKSVSAGVAKAGQNITKTATEVNKGFTSMQGNIGNIAAQFNDIGTTAAMGMNPMLIALQQGTQLSQVFAGQKLGDVAKGLGAAFTSIVSPVSLVTIGLVAAAAAAAQFVVSAFSSGESAEDAAKQLEELRKQVEAYVEASKIASQSDTDLFKNFGNASPELKAALSDLAAIEKIKAYETLDKTSESLKNLVLDLSWWDERGSQAAAQDFLGMFSISKSAREAGAEFASLLNQLSEATDQGERLSTAIQIRDQLDEATGGFENMNAEQRSLYEGVNKLIRDITVLEGQSYDWADAMAAVKSEVSAIASAISNMSRGAISNAAKQTEIDALKAGKSIAEARREAQAMQENLEFDARIEGASNPLEAMAIRAEKSLAETGRALDAELDKEQDAYRERQRLAAKAERDSKKSARSSVSKAEREAEREYNKLLRERDQLLQSLQTPAEKYADQIAKIDELARTRDNKTGEFLISQEEADAAKSRLEQLAPAAVAGRNAVDNLFSSFLDGADSAKAAVAQLLLQIAKIQLSNALIGAIGSTVVGSSFLSGLGSLLTPNANGGVYSGAGINAYSGQIVSKPTVFPFANGTGLMGEAGPEAILPLVRAANGKLGVQAQGGGGQSSGGTVVVQIQSSEYFDGRVAQVSGGVSAQVTRVSDRALDRRIQSVNMRGTTR